MSMPCSKCGAETYRDEGYECPCQDVAHSMPVTTKRWKRTEYADEIWQWNGLEDWPEVVYEPAYTLPNKCHCGNAAAIHGCLWENGEQLCPGSYIIRRGDTYEVITAAEYEEQGWEREE